MVRAQAGPHYWNRNTYREVGVFFFGFVLWLNCTASVWKQNASFGKVWQYGGFGFQLNLKSRNCFALSLLNPFGWDEFRRWDVNFCMNEKLLKNWPLKYQWLNVGGIFLDKIFRSVKVILKELVGFDLFCKMVEKLPAEWRMHKFIAISDRDFMRSVFVVGS